MPSRDLASSGLRHMIEVTVLSHHGSPFFVKVLIFGAKRWQYFTEYVSASGVEVVGVYLKPLQHWFTAFSV